MAELQGDNIANSAGTGAPTFPFGMTSTFSASGTWVPTLTSVSGASGATVTKGIYSRNNSVVTFALSLSFASIGGSFSFHFSPPVASNFSSGSPNAAGTVIISVGGNTGSGQLSDDGANPGTIVATINSPSTGSSVTVSISGSYQVI